MNLTAILECGDVRVWLSVFFGGLDPANPHLNHVRLDATMSGEVLVPKPDRNSVPVEGQTSIFFQFSDAHRLPLEQLKVSKDLRVFRVIENVALSFNEEILSRLIQECPVCEKAPVRFLVHRPLSATRNGYVELQDFEQMRRLMCTVASHATDIKNKHDVKSSIGGMTSDRPYVCTLTVPVCALDSECHRIVDKRIHQYINGILDGKIEPRALQDDCNKNNSSKRTSTRSEDGEDWLAESVEWFYAHGVPDTICETTEEKVYDVGITVFVGRPSLYVEDRPTRGQLSCLAYTSKWPISVIPNANKSTVDQAADYCHIAAFHEPDILGSAKYRCAICSELVAARSLVHRPLAFYKSNLDNSLEQPLRGLVMKFFQYVKGRWKFPETSAALGYKAQAHIFDFVVPICESGTICEETARTATREFIKLLSPVGFKYAFPGLSPDSDLYKYEQGESLCERRTATNTTKKIGPGGLMTEDADRCEDPMAPELTITKLRHWYEMCLAEEEAQKEYGKDAGDKANEKKKAEVKKVRGENYGKESTAGKKPGKDKTGKKNPANNKKKYQKEKSKKSKAGKSKVWGNNELNGGDDSDDDSAVHIDLKSPFKSGEDHESRAESKREASPDSTHVDDNEETSGDELVWIYTRDDHSRSGSSDNNNEVDSDGHDEERMVELVEAGVDRQLLFRPLLTLDFWLLCEATDTARIGITPEREQRSETNGQDCASSVVRDENVDESVEVGRRLDERASTASI